MTGRWLSPVTTVVAVGVGLGLLAGCAVPDAEGSTPAAQSTAQSTAAPASASPAPDPTPDPAATPADDPAWAAGGACHLLDYREIERRVGLRFDVSAASERDDAHSCVVRGTAEPLPDLALTVVPTTTDVDSFETDLWPDDGDEVDQLGRVGYLAPVEAEGDRGPGLAAVWLGGDGTLLTVTLTLPEDSEPDPEAYADGLVSLARAIDRARI